MRFTAYIDMGNEAMQTPEDVARKLYEVADTLNRQSADAQIIRDDNGNTVGHWQIAEHGQGA